MKKSKTLGYVLLVFFLAATLLVAKQKNKVTTNGQPQAKGEQLFAAEPKQYPFTLIAYGDLRTTNPRNHSATDPERRQALIARIATEKPDLLVVNGDLVLSGGNTGDWRE
ncbi:MAG TPA: metallophosphoesterase, partial [Terriglobales bacterium]|nr:metallophosphoesterase [Terriglobales bacterium]